MIKADLPTRRAEAWKYSDLRAAWGDRPLPAERGGAEAAEADEIIARLALAQGKHEVTKLAAAQHEVLIEQVGGGEGLDASLRDVDLAAGASLTRIVVQSGGDVVLNAARVKLGENARFRQFVLADGARLARVETAVDFEGEGGEAELNGLYMSAAGRHADLTSTVRHNVPNCTTRQLTKGAARDGGRGVFQGKIIVAHAAQKTDARQYHHGMLLEDGAEIFSKPELLIHADDVQCAHGNTAGGLDQNALFYLRSRGVPEAQARALLIEAFLAEAIPDGLPESLDADLRARIAAWLGSAP